MRIAGSSRLALVAAIAVLAAAVVAAVVQDDSGGKTASPPVASSTTTVTGITVAGETTTTTSTASEAAPTTVRVAVPTPEAAANGLWASYTSNNPEAAARFATQQVIDTLFASPFNGEQGTFQGCNEAGDRVFECEYAQPSTRYRMIAEADDAGTFEVVALEISAIS